MMTGGTNIGYRRECLNKAKLYYKLYDDTVTSDTFAVMVKEQIFFDKTGFEFEHFDKTTAKHGFTDLSDEVPEELRMPSTKLCADFVSARRNMSERKLNQVARSLEWGQWTRGRPQQQECVRKQLC